ncbi:hypothetical protein [Marinicella meishanensis]|uniref:hypothetical protein n=1 Tax=Marinicella meishanensis TaxID=2873263 RepID=UPI001CBDCAB4|nr:hypothetical protein [Marinicella sp. NBU2979]
MSNDREKLKALLLSEEIAQLKAIQQLLQDKQQLAQKISEVLDPAADLTIAENPEFQKKFSRIDPESYVQAVKTNKQTFIDALLPIIGPMIRKSVTSAIRRFVADVNRAVEMGISAKALRWRWQAFTTGVPFTEIVFNNTIEYQVQQVFLIDNHSGMLIEFAGHEDDLLQDKEAMSAMLTAIQDFVKDAVSKDGEGLSAAELGDDLVWLIHGNQANLAAVIKGAPTARLRDTMTESLESLHLEQHRQLVDESRWNNNPALKNELEKLLLTKDQSSDDETKSGVNFWPWIIGLTALLAWLLWSGYQRRQVQNAVTEQLQSTPGFVLQSLQHDGDQFIATGLQDPLARLPELDHPVVINSTPYLSLADEVIGHRVSQWLNTPGVKVSVNDQQVTLTGEHDKVADWPAKLQLIGMMPGVQQLHDQTTESHVFELAAFLQQHPAPHQLVVAETDQGFVLTGLSTPQALAEFSQLLVSHGDIDPTAVTTVNPTAVVDQINQTPLLFSSISRLGPSQQQQLAELAQSLAHLQAVGAVPALTLRAQSDCQGSIEESNENNQRRLQLVYDELKALGVDVDDIELDNVPCSTTTETIDLSRIGVWFEVTL